MTITVMIIALFVIVLMVRSKIRAERQARLDKALSAAKQKFKIGGTD